MSFKKYLLLQVCAFLTILICSCTASAAPPHSFSIKYDYSSFDKTYTPWKNLAVQYSQKTAIGSVIGRANIATRFNTSGTQYEIDAYPKLEGGIYFYLNAGLSSDTKIFPASRYGAEIYKSLPNSFEGSFGFRQLNFTSSSATIYTLSIGKYIGNYWVSYRHYASPSTITSAYSGNLWIRRYLNDEEYFTIKIKQKNGYNDDLLVPATLNEKGIGFDIYKRLKGNFFLTGSIGFNEEEISLGNYRNTFNISTGIKVGFN